MEELLKRLMERIGGEKEGREVWVESRGREAERSIRLEKEKNNSPKCKSFLQPKAAPQLKGS